MNDIIEKTQNKMIKISDEALVMTNYHYMVKQNIKKDMK